MRLRILFCLGFKIHELQSKLLERGRIGGDCRGYSGHARSLDYSSCVQDVGLKVCGFKVWG